MPPGLTNWPGDGDRDDDFRGGRSQGWGRAPLLLTTLRDRSASADRAVSDTSGRSRASSPRPRDWKATGLERLTIARAETFSGHKKPASTTRPMRDFSNTCPEYRQVGYTRFRWPGQGPVPRCGRTALRRRQRSRVSPQAGHFAGLPVDRAPSLGGVASAQLNAPATLSCPSTTMTESLLWHVARGRRSPGDPR
jgi:hypothetical protein